MVLVGCGVEVTFEVIAAAAILRNQGVKVRVVNVTDLLILGRDGVHPHALDQDAFDSLFTVDKPVVFNFHGYPKDVEALLFSRRAHVGRSRVRISINLFMADFAFFLTTQILVVRHFRLHRGRKVSIG